MKIFKLKNGFTLVELLIAVALFVTVATVSIGAVLSIFDANKKARSSKTVVDNFNLSIEDMTRIIRFGKKYHCGSGGSLGVPKDCSSNTPGNGDTSITVTFYDDDLDEDVLVTYEWDSTNKSITKSYNGESEESITSPDTKIEYLKFYVFGAESSADSSQPYVVAIIKGYVGTRPTNQTEFSIQTLMSQRELDYTI